METEFIGLSEKEAVAKALVAIGFAHVIGMKIFVVQESGLGVFSVRHEQANTFDQAIRYLGGNLFNNAIVIPERRKQYHRFSQMLMECHRLWEDGPSNSMAG